MSSRRALVSLSLDQALPVLKPKGRPLLDGLLLQKLWLHVLHIK
jgi:hypothetical protein